MEVEEILASLVAGLRAGMSLASMMGTQEFMDYCPQYAHAPMSELVLYQWLIWRSGQYASNNERALRVIARYVMAAYQVSNTLGCPMAQCVQSVADAYHAQCQAQDLRSQALALPKATIKLLAALPFLALFGGELVGAKPLRLLFFTTQGYLFLCVGVSLYVIGMLWVWMLLRASCNRMGCVSQ